MRTPRMPELLVIGLIILSSVISCGQNRIATLYSAERDLWNAMRVERTLSIGPETPPSTQETERVIEAYGIVLGRYHLPMGEAETDTVYLNGMTRILSAAQMGTVRMHRIRGEAQESRMVLEQACEAYPWDPSTTLRFYEELITEMQAARDPESAARVCQKIASKLPARTPNGKSMMSVLDAPVRAADLLKESGRIEESLAELDRAEIYFRAVINENPEDEAASLALVNLGTVAMRRGQFARAAELLDEAARSPGAGSLQPRILFFLGTLHQAGLQNLEESISIFRQIVSDYPDDPFAVEALGLWAFSLAKLQRINEAIEVLDRIEKEYPRERARCASAHMVAARILSEADRWQEALSRYRALQAGYATSPEAMTSYFDIAAHYRQVGEYDAERTTLQRAIQDYDRICEERPGSDEARFADLAATHALGRLDRWAEASERLLQIASRYSRGAYTASAMIEAAAIIAEHLQDAERAAEVLERLAETCPGSLLATEALNKATKLRGQ